MPKRAAACFIACALSVLAFASLAAQPRETEKSPAGSPGRDLVWAAFNCDLDGVKSALAKGADIDFQDPANAYMTALIRATEAHYIPVIEYLLEKGAAVDVRAERGTTALLHAVRVYTKADVRIVRMFLQHKANIELSDDYGVTPLIQAAEYDTECVRLLLEAGAQVNASDFSGLTPLMAAARSGKPETIELLLGRGAEIDARDKWGRTALIQAAMHGKPDSVDALLRRGADSGIRDKAMMTALEWARKRGHAKVVSALSASPR